MVLLKELWDMITMVESSMTAWRTTSWRRINVEDMELECKRFSKEIRLLDKEVGAKHSSQLPIKSHFSKKHFSVQVLLMLSCRHQVNLQDRF